MASMTVAYTGEDIGYKKNNVTLMSYLHDYWKKNDIFYVSKVLLNDTNQIQKLKKYLLFKWEFLIA